MMELAMLYVELGVQDAIDWLEDCIEVFPRGRFLFCTPFTATLWGEEKELYK